MQAQESLLLIDTEPAEPRNKETGESIVDKGRTEPRGPRRCIEPESVGLVDAGRAYPCWALPGSYNPRMNTTEAK